ncbi:trehalose-6-phosphate synthase [Desulfuromonas sp. AOP6]|nr:trehalose-6-phosphate synthase [Desulfuromonas sp. AOP6]
MVSNRLPVVVSCVEGRWDISAGSGGLVTALSPVMKQNDGLWIGWPGCGEEAPLNELLSRFRAEEGYRLHPVPLTEEEVERYYWGFSNETLWPLFHDLLGNCNFSLENWQTYRQVNERFARTIAEVCKAGDLLWVHDYQLTLVGAYLRKHGVRQALGYFHHIPFPSLDLFRRLPWNLELIRGLMEYDLLGFQTLRDRRNFIRCAHSLLPDTEVIRRHRHHTTLRHGQRKVRVGHFPISIDFDEFNDAAASKEVDEAAWFLHENIEGRQLLLGVDRLDYTKGIPERLLAFERALAKYPDLMRKISLVQVVVPSRTMVPDYRDLKGQIDQLVGRINAQYSEHGWIPVHYVYRSLDRVQLLAHYRAAEIALVTPLCDGMNLVAKEYCASSVHNNGVLILSEFAGAADTMGENALLVNPYDIEGTADAIRQAFTMPQHERKRRMSVLRADIRRNDVHRWVRRFIETLQRSR